VADFCIPEGNLPSRAKIVDLTMLVLYGGKVRSLAEYRELLVGRVTRVAPVPGELSVIEALPAGFSSAATRHNEAFPFHNGIQSAPSPRITG